VDEAYHGLMADLWVILTVIGFFALCAGLVWGCDRIIGPDDASDLVFESDEQTGDLAEAVR
jgi:hypothetical protein